MVFAVFCTTFFSLRTKGNCRLKQFQKLPNEPTFKKSKPLQIQGFLYILLSQLAKNEPIFPMQSDLSFCFPRRNTFPIGFPRLSTLAPLKTLHKFFISLLAIAPAIVL